MQSKGDIVFDYFAQGQRDDDQLEHDNDTDDELQALKQDLPGSCGLMV